MDQQHFRIPKQNDRSLISALVAIRDGMKGLTSLVVRVTPHHGASHIDINDEKPGENAAIAYILSENSEIMPRLSLFDPAQGARTALSVERDTTGIADKVTVHWQEWGQNFPQAQRAQAYVKLTALARKHLRPFDVEANLSGATESEWSRYRDSQTAILNSLQETQKTIAVDFSQQIVAAESALKAKYEKLEKDLRDGLQSREEKLSNEHSIKLKAVTERETAIIEREKSFNTKEARYVARQGQQEQIDDIKKWLEGWNLTKGTSQKRQPVLWAYIGGALITGFLAIQFSLQNVEILKGKDLSNVAWWQWTLLSLKTVAPLAAFTTFIVYLIRWTSLWARQHSEEEFRNRARVLDIGRARWLLEAVRDAQDNQKELPAELLKDLSRNLFSYQVSSDTSDGQPRAIGDFLMQGLSSLRVKSPDGTEVEASRTKKS